MKKFVKGASIAGGICLLAGLLIVLIGVLGGGVKNFRRNYIDAVHSEDDEKINKVMEVLDDLNRRYGISLGIGSDSVGIFDNKYEKYGEGVYEVYDVEARKLEIVVGAGKLYVKYYDDNFVKLEVGKHDQMQCFVEENTLKIIGGSKLSINGTGSDMTVYLPESFSYDEIVMDVGAGSLAVEKLDGDKITIDLGMGNAILNDVNAKNVDLSVGMGNLEIEGTLTGDANIDCGMGQVVLELFGNGKDFNYELECGIGSLKVEDVYSIVGIGEKNISNGAAKKMDVSVGMGSVEIRFNE